MSRLLPLLAILCVLFLRGESLEALSSRHLRRLVRSSRLRESVDDVATALGPDYVFVPPEVGPEIYVGTAVSLVPIVWATYEFTNRCLPPAASPSHLSST